MKTDLCPSCARRPVDTPQGFCSTCVVERAAERYSEADRRRVELRTKRWATIATETRTDARTSTLRQQRKRQMKAVRPTKASTDVDPWDLCVEAVGLCKKLSQSFPGARSDLEVVAEAIRRLAWGPDEQEEVTAS